MASERNQGQGESSSALLVRALPTLIALLGIAASLLLQVTLRNRELDEGRRAFELAANDRVSDVERQMRILFEQLHFVVALFDGSQEVEADEFRLFTRGSFDRNPSLRWMAWIKDPTDGGLPVFTIRFVDGPDAALTPPEYDLGQHPGLRAALQRVRAVKYEVLSAAMVARELDPVAREGETRVLALLPAYSRGEVHHGFVGALLDLGRLLARVSAGGQGLRTALEDASADPPQLLAGARAETEFEFEQVLDLGGRRLNVVVGAPEGFSARYLTWRPWGALVLGLLATGFLAAAVAAATSRARIQRLVERRSREVQAAYDTLAHEAQQRLWAMMETRQTQRRLREIIDLVPDWIYVKDRYGRYLLANQATARALGKTVEQLTAPADSGAEAHTPDLDRLQRAERALVDEQRSMVTPPTPFVDAQGRRLLVRTHKIPFTFEDEARALLCVATDVTREEQATETLRAQNRILADLARGTDPELVLAQLVRAAEDLVPGMRCSILLLSPDGRHLRHGYAPSLPDAYNQAIDGIEIGPDVGSCGAAAHTGQRVVIEDVMTHPNWQSARELARRAGIRSSWSEPIRASDGEILGTFAMYYGTPRSPDEHETAVMESWAHLAGIAIERRRLVS